MTIQELLETTILLEHLRAGGKKSCAQVNKVFKYLKKPEGLFTKKQKIRLIEAEWNRIGDEVLKSYLINKQNPEKNEFSGNTTN